MTPVDVSLCVRVAQSYFPVERYCSTMSGVRPWPHSTSCLSAGTPLPWAISNHRLPNVPTEKTMARRAVQQRMAPSMSPLPEEAENKMGFAVPASFCTFPVRRFCSSEYSPLLWPIMGVAMAWRTSGWTSVGPGMNNFLCGIERSLLSSGCITIRGMKEESRSIS